MNVNFNSFVSVSTCDYYTKSSCVVFFNECNFRCNYCYNKQTWDSKNIVDTGYIKALIKSTMPFVSAVTFSGGEPFIQFDALKQLVNYSKSIGLSVAIETNGYFTERTREIKTKVDEIYVDIKAPINNTKEYCNNTGVYDASKNIINTLNTGIPTELRIVDNYNVPKIKKSLKDYNYPIRILPFKNNED